MNKEDKPDLNNLSERLQVAAHLQEIEGNPLDADDIAMFTMFEREGWNAERRRAYILAQAKLSADSLAAE